MRRILPWLLRGALLSPLVAWTARAQVAAPAERVPTVPTGSVAVHVVPDRSLGRTRKVWVYTPPGYNPRRSTPYPLIIAFGAARYRDSMPLARVLDSLVGLGRTPAMVAVLVEDADVASPRAQSGNADRGPAFVGRALVPWVRRRWQVTRDPARTIAMGASADGWAAAHRALMRPDLVGNVFAQSGVFGRGPDGANVPPFEWLTQRVGLLPKARVRFILDVGEHEDRTPSDSDGPNLRDATRRFRDALIARGYEAILVDVAGGSHDERSWRPRVGAGVLALSALWPSP